MKQNSLNESYQKLLHNIASQLSSECELPVSVKDACNALNILLTRVDIGEKKVVYLKTPNGIEIRLPAHISNSKKNTSGAFF